MLGSLLAEFDLLIGQPQNLARIGHHRQTVVLEEPASVALANRAGVIQRRVAGEVQFRGIVEDEDDGMLAHDLASLVPVRGLDGLQRGRLLVAETIEPLELGPVEDLGERLLGAGGDLGGRLDQPAGPPLIAEIDLGEVVFDQSRQDWDVIEPSMALTVTKVETRSTLQTVYNVETIWVIDSPAGREQERSASWRTASGNERVTLLGEPRVATSG